MPFLGQDLKHRQIIPPDAAVVLPGVTALIAPERESARVDRVVAWGAGRVAIFPAGKSTPLFSVDAFPPAGNADAPIGVAWSGDTALVWGHSRLVAIDASAAGNGKKLWDIDIARIAEVRLVGERVLVSTSTGELQALDIDSGRMAWQRSLGQPPFERLLATQDFIVVKLSDDIACRLVAMDTYTGRVLGTKAFAVQVIDPLLHVALVPVNLALSAGGTLVYTMPDRLCIKDLYKPWDEEEKVARGRPDKRSILRYPTGATGSLRKTDSGRKGQRGRRCSAQPEVGRRAFAGHRRAGAAAARSREWQSPEDRPGNDGRRQPMERAAALIRATRVSGRARCGFRL